MPTIVHQLVSVAKLRPGTPALSWHGVAWSYGDLHRAMACVVHRLREVGLQRGDRVAILLRNSPQYVAAFYGTLAAGCVAVPLNTHERANVLAHQVEHVSCGGILADPNHPEWADLSAAIARTDCHVLTVASREDTQAFDAFCGQLGGGDGEHLEDVGDTELAMIIFTSGTTSRPKAVMLSHRNLIANARAIVRYLEIQSSDKVLCVLPFHFSYGNSVLNSNLIAGAHILVEDNLAFPHLTMQRIQDEGVTGLPGVPATFALLLGRCQFRDYDLSRLRYLTQAGGPMPRAHLEQIRQQLPGVRVFVMYGQTEATARLTFLPPARLDDKLGSVGVPIDGMEIQVRAAECPLPALEVGEVCARGSSVMMGYWGDRALSDAVLRDGWLHTGDLGHLDQDGFLYIDGRVQEMIKVGAFRVSPQEVEEVLAAHPSVEEAAATGIPDPVLGQAVKAVIVLRAGCLADSLSVKAHCRSRLAGYKVPKVIEFAETLPRTSSGKVQRHKLSVRGSYE